jgi:hypothetical protein
MISPITRLTESSFHRTEYDGSIKMQFMVLFSLNPDKAQTPPAGELLEAEFDAVRGLYMDGLIRQVWLRSDGSGAVAIVEDASTDAAAAKLGALPMVRAGVLQAPAIMPLSPYWGFAPRSKQDGAR